ncbi:H-NS histone family protein [Curvibacter sp. APW13]|uniref:H-NS histone family protein n=1 Tax=Curvibacter sp. APW13 TaxID=3077236 RepID=UPI0028DDC242|nr:H-NS histone family protein [Curvibacter sp. APW13]MDT8992658.1 H-NS histone family protein [Curvibacter sp. APW13]
MTTLLSLQAQIAELQQKAAQIKSKEFAATLADIQAKMKAFGITFADLKTAQNKPKAGRKGRKAAAEIPSSMRFSKLAGVKVEPKYRNGDGQTWTGRGVAPKWMSEAIAAGRSKDEFLINKA